MEQEQDRKGVFVALEGGDEAYVGGVFELLKERLQSNGHKVLAIKFPNLHKSSGYFVAEYLNDNQSNDVGPYAASLFSALDRYDSSRQINEFLNDGDIVLVSGFSGATMAKQGQKFALAEERRGYFIWNDALEYEMLAVPRPDISLVLQSGSFSSVDGEMPAIEEVYRDICSLFTKDFMMVDVVRNNLPLVNHLTTDIVWSKLQPLLPDMKQALPEPPEAKEEPERPQLVSPDEWEFLVPGNMPSYLQEKYINTLEQIRAINNDIVEGLAEYFGSEIGSQHERLERIYSIIRATKPLAAGGFGSKQIEKEVNRTRNKLQELADNNLKGSYGELDQAVKLSYVSPRNELDLVPILLYQYSNLSSQEIEEEVAGWSYDKREIAFQTALNEGEHSSPLKLARYSFDMLCEFTTFQEFRRVLNEKIRSQTLTPRYGYEVPAVIEDADLTEIYEECFELSFGLYSDLQSGNYGEEAQYASLGGHKLRCEFSCSAEDIKELMAKLHGSNTAEVSKILELINLKLSETHPLIAEAIISSESLPN
jgi:hypothetical protein